MSDAVQLRRDLSVSATENLEELVHLNLAASAALNLPGFKASVEGIGVALVIGVTIGPDGVPRLVPKAEGMEPRGMAAELTLPIVSGGGYLGRTNEEFRGAFAANMGLIQASAFAVLGTREFSLLVLLAAEFTPPLQLSFGFTLLGVGGLVGINRRADTDALRDAAMSGRLSQLLFPRDPVAEADRLLGTLSACFPHEDGSVVIGPMIKVGWGTPTIISATLATIAEPTNARVIILGRVAVTLPAEDVAIVRIEAVIFGTLDDRGVALDGSLVDSHIIGMPIRGDLAIRLQGGTNGSMVFSAGGFYPGFTAPPGLGGMRRLSMDVSPAPILRLGLQAYVAVTSSAVMFGARIDLMAGFDGFGVRGSAEFNALLSIDPFYFTADLRATVSITCADFDVASVSLQGSLQGPAPWSIRGHATISILFWDVDVDLPEITWGPNRTDSLPPPDPLAVLKLQVEKRENWIRSSTDIPGLVRLQPTPKVKDVAVHPLGAVEFRQSAIPLDIEIRRVDGRSLAAPATLTMETKGVDSTPVTAAFAPVRFFDVDPATSTGSSAFDELPAGRRVTRINAVLGRQESRSATYEQKVLMTTNRRHRIAVPIAKLLGSLTHLAVAPPVVTPPITVMDHHVVVAATDKLGDAMSAWQETVAAAADADAGLAVQRDAFVSATQNGTAGLVQAQSVMRQLGTPDLGARDRFQVVAAWEVQAR